MRKIYSGVIVVYRSHNGWVNPRQTPTTTHIDVYQAPGSLPVVIATELDENKGMSITNAAEHVASYVWREYLKHSREGMVWFEHYPHEGPAPTPEKAKAWSWRYETFSRVEFDLDDRQPFTLRQPQWKHVTREVVEAMVGERLPVVHP